MEKEKQKQKENNEYKLSNDNKIAHLEFIENTINKMTQYSISFKEWTVGVIVALFSFTADKDINKLVLTCASIAIVITFMALDMFYLWQERKYRILYNIVRNQDEQEINFSMSTCKDELKKYCEEKKDKKGIKNLKYLYAIHSKSIFLFYLIIIVVCILLFIFGASCGGNE